MLTVAVPQEVSQEKCGVSQPAACATPLGDFGPSLLISRETSNDSFLVIADGRRLRVKLYRGPAAVSRRDCERAMHALWRAHGFAVPAVHDRPVACGTQSVCLVMDYVPGVSLRGLLQDPRIPAKWKWRVLGGVFAENRRRHDRVVSAAEPRLVHPDGNSGNIIIDQDGRPVYIDFETITHKGDAVDAVAAEMAKLARWAVADLGIAHLDRVVAHMCDAYAGREEFLQRIVDRVYRRPWQVVHRLRDRRRKAACPGAPTKYDIAAAVRQALHDRVPAGAVSIIRPPALFRRPFAARSIDTSCQRVYKAAPN